MRSTLTAIPVKSPRFSRFSMRSDHRGGAVYPLDDPSRQAVGASVAGVPPGQQDRQIGQQHHRNGQHQLANLLKNPIKHVSLLC